MKIRTCKFVSDIFPLPPLPLGILVHFGLEGSFVFFQPIPQVSIVLGDVVLRHGIRQVNKDSISNMSLIYQFPNHSKEFSNLNRVYSQIIGWSVPVALVFLFPSLLWCPGSPVFAFHFPVRHLRKVRLSLIEAPQTWRRSCHSEVLIRFPAP